MKFKAATVFGEEKVFIIPDSIDGSLEVPYNFKHYNVKSLELVGGFATDRQLIRDGNPPLERIVSGPAMDGKYRFVGDFVAFAAITLDVSGSDMVRVVPVEEVRELEPDPEASELQH